MQFDLKKLAPFAKAVAAALGTVITVLVVFAAVASDGHISGEDMLAILAAFGGGSATTAAVYQTKNTKQ